MNNPRRIQRHLVRALAAGALLAAAALPLAIATEAGATGTPTLTSLVFTPAGATSSTVASGASGTVAITGTNFIDNGGNVSITTNAAANTFTFSDVVETSATTATADYAASGTAANTAPGTYNATLTDTNGSATLTNAFTVTAAPTATSTAPNTIYEGTGANTVTLTGSGFETGATVSFANTNNGTPLTDSVTSISASGTSIVLSITPTDPVNSAAAATGTYAVTVTNPDGGSVTTAAILTVTNGIQEISPSAVAATAQASSDSVTLTGSGFEPGLGVVVNGDTHTEISNVAVGAVTANSVVVTFTETGTTPELLTITTNNPATNVGGNGLSYTSAAGSLGIGEASTVAPIITGATAPTTAVAVGSTGVPVTLTGTGFSLFSALSSTATGVTFSAPTSTTGTSITAPVAVASGASTGAVPVKVTNTAAASAPFASAFSVAGPAVTSSTPAAIAVGTKYGTAVTLTGTGFTATTALAAGAIPGGTGLAGDLSYTSPTTLTFTVTTSPTAAGTATLNIVQSTATGNVLTSYALTVDAPPTLSGLVTFPTGAPTDVGVGATATTVYINGGAFQKGATVTAFTNASGAADPDVTAKVTNVTPTVITATIAVAAGDTNNAVGYTVTNPDGGSVTTTATQYPILIGKGPSITSITPTTGAAGATTSFAVAGTGFQTGAVVTLSPANGTCGTATVSASTTLAVTCTLGTAGVTPTYLVVTNADGGSATSTTAVLGAAVVVAPFHVNGAHGAAVAGKTVTITVSGTGFYGQPKVTATGYKFGVTKDTGTLLTIRVTAKAGLSGEHLLTVTLANGKSGKAGFDTKK